MYEKMKQILKSMYSSVASIFRTFGTLPKLWNLSVPSTVQNSCCINNRKENYDCVFSQLVLQGVIQSEIHQSLFSTQRQSLSLRDMLMNMVSSKIKLYWLLWGSWLEQHAKDSWMCKLVFCSKIVQHVQKPNLASKKFATQICFPVRYYEISQQFTKHCYFYIFKICYPHGWIIPWMSVSLSAMDNILLSLPCPDRLRLFRLFQMSVSSTILPSSYSRWNNSQIKYITFFSKVISNINWQKYKSMTPK